VSAVSDDELVVALARATVARAAPEELVLFPAASEAYLDGHDPGKGSRGDPMLGFGVETAVVLLTPVALTVAKDVLGFLRAQLEKRAAEHGDKAIDWLVDRLLRRNGKEPAAAGAAATTVPDETLELTDEQLEQVRQLALEKAQQLELPDVQAKLLADSLVGSLATA